VERAVRSCLQFFQFDKGFVHQSSSLAYHYARLGDKEKENLPKPSLLYVAHTLATQRFNAGKSKRYASEERAAGWKIPLFLALFLSGGVFYILFGLGQDGNGFVHWNRSPCLVSAPSLRDWVG